ncbi:nicotinate-nucleotide adenylyltransferase [Natronospora cellulosivora (SeqCode)]
MHLGNIAIFGGTFNPIHYGHLLIAEQAVNTFDLDKLIFMPAGQPPHKDNNKIISAKNRMEMLKLAIEDNSNFALSSYELDKQGKSYTVDTLRHFLDLKTVKEVFFIIGADSLLDLFNWRQADFLIENASFIVALRPGFDIDLLFEDERYKPYKDNIYVMDSVFVDHSSTRIRNWLREGKSIRYQMPDAVIDYIHKYKLYKG